MHPLLRQRIASSLVRKAWNARSPILSRSAGAVHLGSWYKHRNPDEGDDPRRHALGAPPGIGSVRCLSRKNRDDDDFGPSLEDELEDLALDPDALQIPEKPVDLLDDDPILPLLDSAFSPLPPAPRHPPPPSERDLFSTAFVPPSSSASTTSSSSSSSLSLNTRKGRMWEDPWDVEELIAHTSTTNSDDLPDWSPQYVSRTSLDRVRIHPDKIPTLSVLAKLPLPPPPPPHPSRHAKAYALHRKRQQYRHVQKLVGTAVPPSRIFRIQSLPSWEDKQDAVDELFEQVETELKDREPILGKHPNFGTWVEKALEEHLRGIGKKISDGSASSDLAVKPGAQSDDVAGGGDETAVPVFMDCFVDGKDSDDSVVPSIVSPLGAKSSDGGGRMVEEWELAAHRTSKRILLRQSTREAARLMAEVEAGGDSGPSRSSTKRILLHGRQGVGKTAALAALVASARTSGCVVLYVADTDDLRRNGFYVEPNPRHPGVFDLPVLSQLICQQLLKSHEADLSTFDVPPGVLQEHFTPDQLKQLGVSGGGGAELSLANVLKAGAGKPPLAPGCYSVAMEILMTQDKVPFWVAVDEFNCLLEPSLYYHMDYDVDVKKPIPLDQISLFRPLLRAMQVSYSSDPLDEDGTLSLASESSAIRRGGAVAATSESRAVSRKLTDGLVECARLQAASAAGGAQSPIRVVEVPRLSALEVEHVLANYEAVGIGKLRMDQGETVLNEQEVAYLRIVSGGVAQRLMDACIL